MQEFRGGIEPQSLRRSNSAKRMWSSRVLGMSAAREAMKSNPQAALPGNARIQSNGFRSLGFTGVSH